MTSTALTVKLRQPIRKVQRTVQWKEERTISGKLDPPTNQTLLLTKFYMCVLLTVIAALRFEGHNYLHLKSLNCRLTGLKFLRHRKLCQSTRNVLTGRGLSTPVIHERSYGMQPVYFEV